MEQIPTIEQFREMIRRQLSEKGVYPPKPGSEQERVLYERWLAGQKKLDDQTMEQPGGVNGST